MKIADPELLKLLRAFGLSERTIQSATLETRVLQDLGFDGDSFDEFMDLLSDQFGCDMSGFQFERYCHSEGELLFPFSTLRWVRRRFGHNENLEPVTLGMLAEVLRQKRWPF